MADSIIPRQKITAIPAVPVVPRAGEMQPGTPYTQLQWQQMQNQNKEMANKENKSPSLGEQLQEIDDEQEGNVALGRIGKNYPKDTRAAEVLLALGIMPDIMKAIIASGQLAPHANR
jgi:hypothetical protein